MITQLPLDYLHEDGLSERIRMVQSLATFREQWQLSTNNEDLLVIEVPLGLMLSDIVRCLDLSEQEQFMVLGGKLWTEVKTYTEQAIA